MVFSFFTRFDHFASPLSFASPLCRIRKPWRSSMVSSGDTPSPFPLVQFSCIKVNKRWGPCLKLLILFHIWDLSRWIPQICWIWNHPGISPENVYKAFHYRPILHPRIFPSLPQPPHSPLHPFIWRAPRVSSIGLMSLWPTKLSHSAHLKKLWANSKIC